MRRGAVAGGVAVVVVVGGGSALAWTMDGGEAQAGNAVKLRTVAVSRGDLVDTETVDGKLTHDGVREVWTGASGVVTWAPEK
ncbi:hypothetical protein E1264_19160, partial [Actinomadura sp. KC216]